MVLEVLRDKVCEILSNCTSILRFSGMGENFVLPQINPHRVSKGKLGEKLRSNCTIIRFLQLHEDKPEPEPQPRSMTSHLPLARSANSKSSDQVKVRRSLLGAYPFREKGAILPFKSNLGWTTLEDIFRSK
ncbi:hypothetical protein J6590_056280 [Homalodisca vitripennis]|nr:hypothetical protein J6590_056280 [Homalodisca vitripennis]